VGTGVGVRRYRKMIIKLSITRVYTSQVPGCLGGRLKLAYSSLGPERNGQRKLQGAFNGIRRFILKERCLRTSLSC
jgi:hypothetical protein